MRKNTGKYDIQYDLRDFVDAINKAADKYLPNISMNLQFNCKAVSKLIQIDISITKIRKAVDEIDEIIYKEITS